MIDDDTEETIKRAVKRALEEFAASASERCAHRWIEKRNGLPAVFFNGTNAYIQCDKCGKREKC
jgi:hypothetical protein